MDMFQTPHTLQCRPILEPQHMILRVVIPLSRKSLYKRPSHKLLNQPATLIRQVSTVFLDRHRGAQPHAQVRNSRRKTVWPVVAEDLVIRGIGKGDRIVVREDWLAVCHGGAAGVIGAGGFR